MVYKILSPFVLIAFCFTGSAHSQVSYHNDIQPVFNERCVTCHGGISGVTLSSYSSVINSVGDLYNKNIVIPGEPDESPIVDKISPDPAHGDRMPQDGPPYLDDEVISLIRQWIEEGAHETPPTHIVDNDDIPERFALLGNYPNPFNPSTNIRFQLPRPANWRVRIYTISGKFVGAESGRSQPGEVTVPVHLEEQSSGMYLYVVEIRADEATSERLTGNMLLVR